MPSTPTTLIVGAGPAGLAVAASLARKGIAYTLLEQSAALGDSWRRHYDRLHLHTDKANSGLPYLPMPRDYPRYPSRDQVVAYLEAYAQHFAIEPRFNQCVTHAVREVDEWRVTTEQDEFHAPSLVVAAGYNAIPYEPTWPGQDEYTGHILHSSRYANGTAYKGQRVLVVGMGNSGGEIALDLWEHGAQPTLAVRSPVNVLPREILGVPFLTVGNLQRRLPPRLADAVNAPVGRLLFGDLTRYGLRRPADGPITTIHKTGRVALIDVGTITRIKRGDIVVRPGIERFAPDGVRFSDGREEPFDAVVLATGFHPNVPQWLETGGAALTPEGVPTTSGSASGVPGLYFCGYYISPRGMLREIAEEAVRIALLIAGSVDECRLF